MPSIAKKRRKRLIAQHARTEPPQVCEPGSFEHMCSSVTSLGNPVHGDSELCESCGEYTEYVGDDVFMCFNCD